tara:strand:- start:5108 stop:5221 length:114 start_codon:yes stop_codon:yes gene_type:complete
MIETGVRILSQKEIKYIMKAHDVREFVGSASGFVAIH